MNYTTLEVAKILKVSDRAVRNYLKSGKLKGYKLTEYKWVIPEKSVREYIRMINGGN